MHSNAVPDTVQQCQALGTVSVHLHPMHTIHTCLQNAPELKVAIVGGGLAGLSTAVELLDQG